MTTFTSPSSIRGANVLVLDPAISTGWCILSISNDGEKAIIYAQGFIDVDCTSDYTGDWCIDLQTQLEEMISKHCISHIAVENFFFSKRFANGSTVNVELRTAIYIIARTLGIPYTILGISEWKKFVSGRVTPTKEQKVKWGKNRSKKIAIQEALWERYQIKFPNHSLSKKTGKPITLRLDLVDVVAQAIYFSKIFIGVTIVESVVRVPKDVNTKSKHPTFIYPKVNHDDRFS
jgi:Holliday junction resolvasome RuvABC endonuclease subunit